MASVDIDTEIAAATEGIDLDITGYNGAFSPEWLSCAFMDNLLTNVDDINKKWKDATGYMLLYVQEVEYTGGIKPPKIIPYYGGDGGSGDEALPDGEIPEDEGQLNIDELIVGSITMTESVLLYEDIGGNSINSEIDTIYGLLGIEKHDDKYYFKIVDKSTNKIYLTEVTDKLQVSSEYDKVLELSDKTLVLNSTNIGDENFKRLAESGECFFAKDNIEVEGVTFTSVLDSDGEVSYIPRSNNVKVESLDSLIG